MNTTGYIVSLGLLLISLAHLISSTGHWEAALLDKTEYKRRELTHICRHMAMYDLLFAAINETPEMNANYKAKMNETAIILCQIWVSS